MVTSRYMIVGSYSKKNKETTYDKIKVVKAADGGGRLKVF